jgi:hypothetical protein
LVETNVNLVELGPRETGKTYLYLNLSYSAHVHSGGKATPAQHSATAGFGAATTGLAKRRLQTLCQRGFQRRRRRSTNRTGDLP